MSTELEATVTGLRTNNVVPWSPRIKRPLTARSSMSVEAGRRCEGMRSHREVRRCWGHPS